jgi:hypothetical protein
MKMRVSPLRAAKSKQLGRERQGSETVNPASLSVDSAALKPILTKQAMESPRRITQCSEGYKPYDGYHNGSMPVVRQKVNTFHCRAISESNATNLNRESGLKEITVTRMF